LKRSDSLPARLPSRPAPRAEAKPIRHPITRAKPDANPPEDFSLPPVEIEPPKFCGIPLQTRKQKQALMRENEERIKQGAIRKEDAMRDRSDTAGYKADVLGDSEYADVIRAYHPRFDEYSEQKKSEAAGMLMNHPRFVAGLAQSRNEVSRLPNGPTAARKMGPSEQKFLTGAFRRIKADIREKPFHIHGESGVVGNQEAEITWFGHNPAGSITTPIQEGDKYHLHTHSPYGEPFASSASSQDHKLAAILYTVFDNRMNAYVTNGRDVLHIRPDSTELVKLIPDPKAEKKLGEFPVAFTLPEAQERPYPFANHEAPL
jgi:hypothetical protein